MQSTMKKFLSIAIALAAVLSCNRPENPGPENPEEKPLDSISLSVDRIDFASGSGESAQIEVTTDGEWNVSGYTDGVKQWLEVDAISGNGSGTVILKTIEINPYDTKRMAVLEFTRGTASATVLIQQFSDPERTVNLSVDKIDFAGPAGEKQTLNVVTAKAWSLDGYTDELKTWLSVTPVEADSGMEVTLETLDINEDTEPRHAVIGFRLDRVNVAWLTVSQAPGLELSLESDKIHLACEAGSKGTLSIHSNAKTKDWKIEGVNDANSAWMSFSCISGHGDATVEITASQKNDGLVRSADFTLVLDALHSVPFTVEQGSSLELHVNPATLIFPALTPGTKEVVVTASTDALTWTLEGYTDEVKAWLTVDTESFAGLEKTVKLTTLSTNMETSAREATLRFRFTDGIYADLTVTQEGVKIVDKVITVNLQSAKESDNTDLHADIWAFQQPWHSVDKWKVDGGDLVPGASQKKTAVSFTEGDLTYQIWVTQGYGKNVVSKLLYDLWINFYEANKTVGGVKYDCGLPNGYAWIRFPEYNGILYKMEIQIMSPSQGPFCLATAVDPETGMATEVIETVSSTAKSAFQWVTFNLENQQPNTAYYICMGDGYSYRIRGWKLYYQAYE